MRVPSSELLKQLAAGRRVLGVAVTPLSVEVAVLPPLYTKAELVCTGRFLTPEELKQALDDQQAGAVVLGGTAAFRTDGSLQLGVRKLISRIRGLNYESDWLPSVAQPEQQLGSGSSSSGGGSGGSGGSAVGGRGAGDAARAPQQPQGGQPDSVPVWLCRKGQDDPVRMLVEHVQDHAGPYLRTLQPRVHRS